MVVLIGAEKGGTGKTTLAVNIAVLLANDGQDVLVVDTDQQGSASYFFQIRDDGQIEPRVTCVQKFGKSLPRDVLDLSERYDEIIIDAGGRDSMELRYSLGIASRLYIPLRPSQFDVWTLDQMDDLVNQAKGLNPDIEARVVLNMASPNPANTDAIDTKSIIADYEHLETTQAIIIERVSFQRSVRQGVAVTEMNPTDPKAKDEIISLYKEVYSHDKKETTPQEVAS